MYGSACRYVRVSASFSVARCRRPMCGSARWITSPSSSSTSRSTPCAAGCCGPKFIVKLRISAMFSILPALRDHVGLAVHVFADHARHDLARLDAHRLVDDALLLGVVAHLHVARDRKVL